MNCFGTTPVNNWCPTFACEILSPPPSLPPSLSIDPSSPPAR